jgi:RNA polymerase sigma-70 factor (ECF subfamily)
MDEIRSITGKQYIRTSDKSQAKTDCISKTVELVDRASGGDIDAFGELYSLYVDQIYRYIFFRIKNQMLAEDITEDVFIKAWRSIKSCKGKGQTFMAWLYRIAHNQLIDNIRRWHRESPIMEEEHQTAMFSESEVEVNLRWQEVIEVIASLSPKQEQVITMKFIEGLDNQEIAEILGKSEGAIRVLQMRALANIRQVMKE